MLGRVWPLLVLIPACLPQDLVSAPKTEMATVTKPGRSGGMTAMTPSPR